MFLSKSCTRLVVKVSTLVVALSIASTSAWAVSKAKKTAPLKPSVGVAASPSVPPVAALPSARPQFFGDFPPLVELNGFVINPVFQNNKRQIVHFDNLVYLVTRSWEENHRIPEDVVDPLFEEDRKKGWEIYPFIGKTGGTYPDVPGVVAYHRADALLVVALRGSQNNADWISNMDSIKADQKIHKLNIPGTLHRGFAIKVQQLQESLFAKIHGILTTLSADERERVSYFVSGHSKGAALAHLTGVVLAEELKQYYGSSYDNTYSNKVQVFRLSSPRTVGNKEAYHYTTGVLGKHNDIHQYVQGDPVTVLPPGHIVESVVSHYAGDKFADLFAGFEDTGYLALQYAYPTMKENLNNTPKKSGIKGFFSGIVNLFGTVHYGSNRNGKAVFEPSLVEMETSDLVRRGYLWQAAKKMGHEIAEAVEEYSLSSAKRKP